MKKVMICQPMAGKTDEEIKKAREDAAEYLTAKGFSVINSLFPHDKYACAAMEARGVVKLPVGFLAKSIDCMSKCDAVFFCRGWERARGCRIEHTVAVVYGLEILFEE